MGIKAIDLRRGIAVEWNNKLYTVHDFAKVSKGNWRSFMQVKLRDTGTGSIIEQRFRVDDEPVKQTSGKTLILHSFTNASFPSLGKSNHPLR